MIQFRYIQPFTFDAKMTDEVLCVCRRCHTFPKFDEENNRVLCEVCGCSVELNQNSKVNVISLWNKMFGLQKDDKKNVVVDTRIYTCSYMSCKFSAEIDGSRRDTVESPGVKSSYKEYYSNREYKLSSDIYGDDY